MLDGSDPSKFILLYENCQVGKKKARTMDIWQMAVEVKCCCDVNKRNEAV